MNGPSLNEIISQIRKWKVEVHSGWNDGWTKAHYMIQLNKIGEELEEEPYEIPHIPGLAQDDELNF
tara:strand:+ start:829 stop:1026 length:198 start_codon:yes stop_codon:yes gene_type:complete